jgi:biotin synthase
MTLGMLEADQARVLKDAGLDYYNHNLDSAPEFYSRIIGTRTYEDRLDTLAHVRAAGLKVCCGGIVGMGETRAQRAGLIAQLANLDPSPESVPINNLVPVPGTPLANSEPIDPFARWCACRPAASRWTRRCRHCVSLPAPIRSSTATNC